MQYTAYSRATLLIPSGPGMHLYVVMNDADPDNQHLLLSITTVREEKYFDNTCILEPGEHEFIENRSYVYYKEPMLRHSEHIKQCVEKKVFFPRGDFKVDVFTRVFNGVDDSIHAPKWVKRYILKYCS